MLEKNTDSTLRLYEEMPPISDLDKETEYYLAKKYQQASRILQRSPQHQFPHSILYEKVKETKNQLKAELIQPHLRFVRSIALKYYRRNGHGLPLEDLIQEGNIGLMKAVDKYDPSYDNRLLSYAGYWIEEVIQRAIFQQGRMIRLSIGAENRLLQLSKARIALEQKDPDVGIIQIAQECQLNKTEAKYLIGISRAPLSLEQPVLTADGTTDLADFLQDHSQNTEEQAIETDAQQTLEKILNTLELTPLQRAVLECRLSDDSLTLEVVAQIMYQQRCTKKKVSRERVRQILKHIAIKLAGKLSLTPSQLAEISAEQLEDRLFKSNPLLNTS